MSAIEIFLWGFGGSLAVEIMTVMFFFLRSEKLPDRYRSVVYYIIRFLVACIGGGLAVAFNANNPLLAINIGAAAPLILQFLSQGMVGNPQLINREELLKLENNIKKLKERKKLDDDKQ